MCQDFPSCRSTTDIFAVKGACRTNGGHGIHQRSIPWSPFRLIVDWSERGLPRLAPSQTPQSARREHEGDAPEPAERPECPDKEETARGLGDLAVMRPPHVDD